ncbi:hypothetical protein WMZ97_01690 [Lentibacillus sp. N15]|uniref:hypothetical protein n=1 Tax=Lentibacillus songyuanensis TaxID=3136161 RepID=UPI0031BB86EC
MEASVIVNYLGVDRMINEGLGGGILLYDYDEKKLDPVVFKNDEEEQEQRGDDNV